MSVEYRNVPVATTNVDTLLHGFDRGIQQPMLILWALFRSLASALRASLRSHLQGG